MKRASLADCRPTFRTVTHLHIDQTTPRQREQPRRWTDTLSFSFSLIAATAIVTIWLVA